jgi:hypothetical protein
MSVLLPAVKTALPERTCRVIVAPTPANSGLRLQLATPPRRWHLHRRRRKKMAKAKRIREELQDKAEKLQSAQEAASRPGASQRDRSDLKIIEQDFQAQQQKADRLAVQGEKKPPQPASLTDRMEDKLDKALIDSFPGSDPVSFTEPTPVKKGDESLTPVKVNEQQAAAAQPAPELTIHPDVVCHLIVLAREFNVKDVEADPDAGSNGADDRMIGVLENHRDDPVEAEFRALIDALGEDELTDLVAMLWLGRGDGMLEEWRELRGLARQENSPRTAAYLLRQPLLADHLQEGLSAFGHTCLEFEKSRL